MHKAPTVKFSCVSGTSVGLVSNIAGTSIFALKGGGLSLSKKGHPIQTNHACIDLDVHVCKCLQGNERPPYLSRFFESSSQG